MKKQNRLRNDVHFDFLHGVMTVDLDPYPPSLQRGLQLQIYDLVFSWRQAEHPVMLALRLCL